MKIDLQTYVRPIKAGTEARVPALGLASHGEDEADALERLRKVALTWCLTLQRVGRLQKALSRRGIEVIDESHDSIDIDLLVGVEA